MTPSPDPSFRERARSAALLAILLVGLAASALWASLLGYWVFDGLLWLFM